ncbi:MAG: hypothetical protein LBE79_07655, partial [Tannerella sp.]|nr:hypothetical protein [Tannerella sp.]
MAYHKEYDDYLHVLRDIGVVHVTMNKSVTANAEMHELLSLRNRIKPILDFLHPLSSEPEAVDIQPARKISKQELLRFIEGLKILYEKKGELQIELQT